MLLGAHSVRERRGCQRRKCRHRGIVRRPDFQATGDRTQRGIHPPPHRHRAQRRTKGVDPAHRPGAVGTVRIDLTRQTARVLTPCGHLPRGEPAGQTRQALPLHHPAGHCQRAAVDQRARTGHLQVQAAVSRRYDPRGPQSTRVDGAHPCAPPCGRPTVVQIGNPADLSSRASPRWRHDPDSTSPAATGCLPRPAHTDNASCRGRFESIFKGCGMFVLLDVLTITLLGGCPRIHPPFILSFDPC